MSFILKLIPTIFGIYIKKKIKKKACVRSIMEYASPVWNNAPLYVLQSLDALQRKCQRLFPNISLEPLQLRRDVAGLSIIHQAVHGKCPVAVSKTVLQHGFHQPIRSLRSSVRCHPFNLRQVASRTASHQRSFTPYYTRLWNSLPESIVGIERPEKFRQTLTRHLFSSV